MPPWIRRGVEQRLEQGAIDVRRGEDHLAHFVIEPAAGDRAALARAHLARDREAARRQDGEADLREGAQPHLAAQPREGRVLRRRRCRTGTIGASALSATMPGPSNTFISAPVTVIRPSGKMTSVRPSCTALTIALADIGLVGSTGKASNRPRNGFTHQAWAMRVWMAKVGLPGRKAASSSAVEEGDVVHHHHRALAGLRHVLRAGRPRPGRAAGACRGPALLITVSGSSQQEISATTRVAKPSAPMSAGNADAAAEQHGEDRRPSARVTAALTMLLAAMVRERSSRRAVGLQDRVERDDEHAAGEGDAGEVEQDPPAAARREELRRRPRRASADAKPRVDSHRSIMKAARASAETGT